MAFSDASLALLDGFTGHPAEAAPTAATSAAVPDRLAVALAGTENSGPDAVSPKGASGRMQIMPDTFKQYAQPGERYENEADRNKAALRKIHDDIAWAGGDPAMAAAAYFAGRGGAKRWASGAADPHDGNISTTEYVRRTLSNMGMDDDAVEAMLAGYGRGNAGRLQDMQTDYQRSRPISDSGATVAADADLAKREQKRLDDMGPARRGFERGMLQSEGLIGGAAALAGKTGEGLLGKNRATDWMQSAGMDLYVKKMNEAAKYAGSASFSDMMEGKVGFTDWLSDSAGYGAYQILEAMGTGGAGALLGKTIGKEAAASTLKPLIEKQAAKLTEEMLAKGVAKDVAAKQAMELATKNVAMSAGAAAVMFANNVRMEGGGIYPDAVAQGNPDLLRVWGATLAAAGVETGADMAIGEKLLGTGHARSGSFGTRLAKEIPAQMAIQGGTEPVQGVIEDLGAKKDPFSPDGLRQRVDEAAAGAVMGGIAGPVGAIPRAPEVHALASQPERKPNSPLANAASVAASMQPQTGTTPAADDFATRLSQVQYRLEDPTLLRDIRNAPGLGQQSAQELLSAWAIARNPNLDPMLRQNAMGQIENFFKTFDNRPDFVLGGEPSQQPSVAPGSEMAAPAPGAVAPSRPAEAGNVYEGEFSEVQAPPVRLQGEPTRQLETEQALQAKRTADADYEQAYQDLVKAEQLGASDAELMQMQQELRALDAQRQDADARLAQIQQTIADNRAAGTRAKRQAVLDQILADPATQNPADRFAAELARQGFTDTALTQEEQARISRAQELAGTFNADTEIEPSAPNELEPYAPRKAAALTTEGRKDISDRIGSGFVQIDDQGLSNPATGERFDLPTPAMRQYARNALNRHLKQTAIDQAAHESSTSPTNRQTEPSDAQKSAGNYKMGHIKIAGLDITIENPAGSVRSGVDADGNKWTTVMNSHYGYIRGSDGADGDHVDVFVKPGTPEDYDGPAFVIDQIDPETGRFDEHKTMLGWGSAAEARAGYLENYTPGWKGLGAITGMSIPEFKHWLKNEDTTAPLGDIGVQETAASTEREQPAGSEQQAEDLGAMFDEVLAEETGQKTDTLTASMQAAERWNAASFDHRKDMLRGVGYVDADQIRVLSGFQWHELADGVRTRLADVVAAEEAGDNAADESPAPTVADAAPAQPAGDSAPAASVPALDDGKDGVRPQPEQVGAAADEATPVAPAAPAAEKSERPWVRDIVTGLISRKRFAEQAGKRGTMDKVVELAKQVMAGEDKKPAVFEARAKEFDKVQDAESAALIRKIVDGLKAESNQKRSDAAKQRAAEKKAAAVPNPGTTLPETGTGATTASEETPSEWPQPNEHGVYEEKGSAANQYTFPAEKSDGASLAIYTLQIGPQQWIAAQTTQHGQDGGHRSPLTARTVYPSEAAALAATASSEREMALELADSTLSGVSDKRRKVARRMAEWLNQFIPSTERDNKPTGAYDSTAPEHAAVGVDDRELGQIVREFNNVQRAMMDGRTQVTHVFDAPAKSEIVRLNDKVKVYREGRGWMTVDEARAEIAQWKDHAAKQGAGRNSYENGNSQRIVLSLFDLTGKWSKPWEDAGYQVFRFDIQDDPEVGDVNNFSTEFFNDWFGSFDGMDIYAVLAACPCTDFAVSGARHFAAKDKDGRTVSSVKLVHQTLNVVEYFKPAVWAIENPVGRIEELGGLPPWRLSFDPNHLGDPYTKKTLLWGRFNADLPIAPVEPTEGSKMHQKYGGKSLATKNARSATPEGFSYGFFMANNAVDHPVMAIANKYDRLDRGLIEQAVKAGVTEQQIDSAVEDFYYQDLDDDAANDAIRSLIDAAGSKTAEKVEPESAKPQDGKPANPEAGSVAFTLSTTQGDTRTVQAKPVSFPGFEGFKFYVHPGMGNNAFTVSEGTTHLAIAHGPTEELAIQSAGNMLERTGAARLREAIGKQFKGISIYKPGADLSDAELAKITAPDAAPMRERNADLAKHEGDPRFYVPVEGNPGTVRVDYRLVRDYLRDGSLPEAGKEIDRYGKRLIALFGNDPDAPGSAAAARVAAKVLDAAKTGRYNDLLHPDNKRSRALFEEITGTKLPKGVRDTQALFTGKPFIDAPAAQPAEVQKPTEPGRKFKVGDRVVLSEHWNKELAGRHGTVTEATSVRTTTIQLYGGRNAVENVEHRYHVKTDAGYAVSVGEKDLQAESEKPTADIVPDIEIDGRVMLPSMVWSGIASKRQSAERSMGAAARARKPEIKEGHRKQAERSKQEAATHEAAFQAWAEQHPDAARAASDGQWGAPAAPQSGDGSSMHTADVPETLTAAGLRVTATTTTKGTPVWEVSGETREHAELLKRIGGRWYGPKKVWSFYDADPSAQIAAGLPAVEAKPEPELGENEVRIFGNPYIYRKVLDRWQYIPEGAKYEITPTTNLLPPGSAIIKQLDQLLAEKQGKPDTAENEDLGAMFDEVLAEETGEQPNAQAWLTPLLRQANVRKESSGTHKGQYIATATDPEFSGVTGAADWTEEGALKELGRTLLSTKEFRERNATRGEPVETTAAASPLVKAMNDLAEMQAAADAQGLVADDRLLERIRRQKRLIADLQADAAATEVTSETARRGEFTLKSGERARVVEGATRGEFSVSVGNAKGENMESMGSFQMDDQFAISRVEARANWAMDNVNDAATQFALAQRAEAEPKRSAGEAAASAAKNTAAGLNDAIAGLGKLFGGKGRLSSGLSFDEQTYAQAKPLFQQAIAHFKEAGSDLKEAMRAIVRMVLDQFGPDAAGNMKPYVVRFMEDVRAGATLNDQETTNERPRTGGEGQAALESAPADNVSGTGGERGTGSARQPGGGTGNAGDAGSAGTGLQGMGSRGSRAAEVHPAAGGRGSDGGIRETGAAGQGPSGAADAANPRSAPTERLPGEQLSAPGSVPAENFRITPELRLGQGGLTEKFNDNLRAIQLLKTLETQGRRATADEQAVLARYVGWGGLQAAFERPLTNQDGSSKVDGEGKPVYGWPKGWDDRGQALKALLTNEEYDDARRSTQDAHYTAEPVIHAMWAAVRHLGFRGGVALEPSMGTGNFLGLVPEDMPTRFLGVELDSLTGRIARQLYPQAAVLVRGFQDVPLANNSVDIAIGNPPFGSQTLYDKDREHLSGFSIHNYFFAKSIEAVRPGGVQAMVVSNFLMDKQGAEQRAYLSSQAKLLGAIRLPNTAFRENANTEVTTDIVFLQKRQPGEAFDAATEESWTDLTEIPDPLGGEAIPVNEYFARHPEMMLGRMERSGEMRHKGQPTLAAVDGQDLGLALDAAIRRLPENVFAVPDAVANTEKSFESLRTAMELQQANKEDGAVYFGEDGQLNFVRSVQMPEGGSLSFSVPVTPETPWSTGLTPTPDGKWFRYVAKTDRDGNTVKNDKGRVVYERVEYANAGEVPASQRLGQKKYARLRGLMELRDAMRRQINLEMDHGAEDTEVEANRGELKRLYDAFVKEHGFISESANQQVMAGEPDAPLVSALELSYDPGVTLAKARKTGAAPRKPSATQAPILTQRAIPIYVSPDTAGSPKDALVISLSESGRVNLPRMAALLNGTDEQVIRVLHDDMDEPLIFKDPETGDWQTRDQYLAGPVKRKLEAAKQHGLAKNVEALEKVQPEDIQISDVGVRLGSVWVPAQVYMDFARHLLDSDAVSIRFRKYDAKFIVDGARRDTSAKNTNVWGTPRMPAIQILDALLNSQAVRVYDVTHHPDGSETRVLNEEETAMAGAKATELANEFQDWIYADAGRREQLGRIYNDTYNTLLNRQYDGSHLTLPGKVPDTVIKMRRHQNNAIWRTIQEKYTLLDHVVGAGKTFTIVAAAMELRRMGLAQKNLVVVPNHLVEQWATDFYRLYPGARILAATKKDFEKDNRKRLFSRIATGDWDAVIVAHSSFKKIGIDPATEERMIKDDIAEIELAIREEEAATGTDPKSRRKPRSVKDMERTKDRLKERMKRLHAMERDSMLTFEQLGVDQMFVDEAHTYKNLFYFTRLQNVLGLGSKDGSKQALDLYNKIRVMRERRHLRGGVVFATGTPISNSIVEMYTMMRYLAPDLLQEMGIENFDAWHKQFAEAITAMEMNEAGGLVEKTRMSRFSNMPELMAIYYTFADSVSLDDIKRWYAEDNDGKRFPVPKIAGGKRRNIVIEPTEAQQRILSGVVARFNGLKDIKDWKERNKERLRLMSDARKVALDARVVDPYAPDEPGSKLDRVTKEVKRIYDRWQADRGTQLVFLDLSVPRQGADKELKALEKSGALNLLALEDQALSGDENSRERALEAIERMDDEVVEELRKQIELAGGREGIEALKSAMRGGFTAYDDMKAKLVAMGIPEREIRFVQEANTDKQKQDLFDAVNAGDVRVLMGSTPRMGAGTNVQERLVAEHHVDVTWKPSDIEQREGRIERQGNSLMAKYGDDFEVEINAYATERTYDAKMWSIVEGKMRFINALRHYDGAREVEMDDTDSENMAEMAALASGDPMLLERVRLEQELKKLDLLRRSHRRRMTSSEDSIRSMERDLERLPAMVEHARADYDTLKQQRSAMIERADQRRITVEGQEYDNYGRAYEAAMEAIKLQQGDNDKARYVVEVNGKKLTNKNAIDDEILNVLGDVTPFEAEIDGTTYIRHGQAAKRIHEIFSDIGGGEYQERDIGTYLGMKVSVFADAGNAGLVLEGQAKYHKSWFAGTVHPKEGAPYWEGPNQRTLSHVLENLEMEVYSDLIHYRSRLEAAERDLPDLKAQVGKPFAQEDEYQAKTERFNELTKLLAAQAKDDGKPAATGDSPAMSRSETPAGGMAVDDVRALVNILTANWSGAARVQVVQNPAVLEGLGDGAADLLERIRKVGAERTAEGVYADGTVYLFADRLPDTEAVERVLLHESTHLGLDVMFGHGMDLVLMQVYTRNAKVREKANALRAKYHDLTRIKAVYEVLADMGGDGIEASVWDKLVAFVRGWMRRMGFKLQIDDREIRALITKALAYARGGHTPGGPSRSALSRGNSPWVSPLAKAVDSMPERVSGTSAKAVKQWLSANAGKLGVKQDELQWSGVLDWLDTQGKAKVTKEQVAEYLAQGGVKVEEVTLGDAPSAEEALNAAGYAMEYNAYDESYSYTDPDGDIIDFDELPPELQAAVNGSSRAGQGPTKFASYQLPGGENYRELLLTLPANEKTMDQIAREKGYGGWSMDLTEEQERDVVSTFEAQKRKPSDRFKSTHFAQPNILAHVRFNERTDADGKRVLFLEEIQSDWGQKGKKEGFEPKQEKEWVVRLKDGGAVYRRVGSEREAESLIQGQPELEIVEGERTIPARVPAAPFVTDTKAWVALALKRMIAYAAENGFDRVAWTNGEQQADRYDLSRQVQQIFHKDNRDGTYFIDVTDGDGKSIVKGDYSAARLEDVIGKEITKKIIDEYGDDVTLGKMAGTKVLAGEDLKVGGEGMRAFYDKIVPSVANDVLKKLGGGKVGKVTINGTKSRDDLAASVYGRGETYRNLPSEQKRRIDAMFMDGQPVQPGFDITPELRAQAADGMPLFSRSTDPFVQEVLTELAASDALFRYPVSRAVTLDEVMAKVFPDARYVGDETRADEREESGADRRLMFQSPQGANFYVYERGPREVWIDVSRLEEGGGGAAIYAAVANYAYNTGKVFVGDPSGLSEAAIVRRTSNMLSSALRFGTTRHLEPAPEQLRGVPEHGIAPLVWSGSEVDKVAALAHTFVTTLQNQFPAIRDYRYDFQGARFVDRTGRPVSGLGDVAADQSGAGRADTRAADRDGRGSGAQDHAPDIGAILATADARAARIGEASLRRGILIQSLVESAGGARPGILEQVFAGAHSLVEQGSLGAVFSRQVATQPSDDIHDEEAATDAYAQHDIDALERAIERALGGDTSAEGAYKAVRLRDGEALDAIGRAFGADIRGFEVTGDRRKFGFFDGVYVPGNTHTIYLKSSTERPHLAVLGHELVHRLRQTNPELYLKFVEAVRPYIQDDRYRAWSNLWTEKGEKLLEEFMGEVVSDGFMDKGFWQALAAKNRSMFRQVVAQLSKLLDQVFKTVGYTPKTRAILSDYEAVMRIAGEVMAEAGINADAVYGGDQDARFSRSTDIFGAGFNKVDESAELSGLQRFANRVPDGWVKPLTDRVAKMFRNTTRFGWLDKSIHSQLHKASKNKYFAETFKRVQQFMNDASRAALRPAELAPTVLPRIDVAQSIRPAVEALLKGKAAAADIDTAFQSVLRGTLDNTVYRDAEAAGLDDAQFALYREFRDAVDASLDEMAAAEAWTIARNVLGNDKALKQAVLDNPTEARALIADPITQQVDALNLRMQAAEEAGEEPNAQDAAELDALKDVQQTLGRIFARRDQLQNEGYAPLMRFGRYSLYVYRMDPTTGEPLVDDNGETVSEFFGLFESEAERDRAEQDLREEYAGQESVEFETGTVSEEAWKLYRGVSPETVALFADAVGVERDEVFQEWYRKASANRSALKRLIHRKGVPGFSTDGSRVLASFLTSNGRRAAQQYHTADILDSVEAFPKTQGVEKDEAVKMWDYIQNPQEEQAGLRSLMFFHFLGGTLSNFFINATQPAMMTLPFLAQQVGMPKAMSLLKGAYKHAWEDRGLPADVAQALAEAEQEGVVGAQEIHHLWQETARPLVNQLGRFGEDITYRAHAFMRLWGLPFALAEHVNRRVTFISAFEAAKERGLQGDAAYAEAVRAVNETQIVYNKSNRPNWARGNVGSLIFTFKLFSIAYVELLVRMLKSGKDGQKAALYMLGMLMLASGLQGLPGGDDLDDMIDTAAQLMGYNMSTTAAKKKWLENLAGEQVAEFLMYGMSAMTPLDVHSRMGLGNLIPGTGLFKPSNDRKFSDVLEIVGPVGGLMQSYVDTVDAVESGNWSAASTAWMPKALRDVAKGAEMAVTGEYRDTSGRKVEDITPFDAMVKAIGFQPQNVAATGRDSRGVQQRVDFARRRESIIVGKWARAITERDPEGVQAAMREIQTWNDMNPDTPIVVKRSQVQRRVVEMKATKDDRLLKSMPRELRDTLGEELQ